MRRDDKPLGLGLGASLALHALAGLVVCAVPRAERLEVLFFEAELDLMITPEPEPEPAPPEPRPEDAAPEPEPTPAPTPPPPAPARPRRAAPGVRVLPTAPVLALPAPAEPSLGPAPPLDDEPTPEAHERERIRIATILDPGRYAHHRVLDDDPGPSHRGAPAGGGDREGGVGPDIELLSEAEAEARHGEVLEGAAAARDWLSHTPIVPVEQTDGTWLWEGPLFTATIDREGAVHFEDEDPAAVDWWTGTMTFDLTDLAMRAAGLDPFASERERFMEETEALRERLERESAERRSRTVSVRARVWTETTLGDEDRSWEARRREVFAAWDACAEDGDGRVRRDAILEVVRSELPAGSPHAYPAEELDALNALRESEAAFTPY